MNVRTDQPLRTVSRAAPGRDADARRDVGVGHLEHLLTVPTATVRGFAGAVADALHDGVLPYADRMRLLKRAERLGIGRFDANLIIASVRARLADTPPTFTLVGEIEPASSPTHRRLPALVVIATVQAIIIALAVALF
jgi:hypothetical protein